LEQKKNQEKDTSRRNRDTILIAQILCR